MRYSSRLLVNRSILQNNISKLQVLAPHNCILAMVKADGYGHDMAGVVEVLLDNRVQHFGVASLGEGIKLRQAFPQQKFEVYIFSDLSLQEGAYQEYYRDFRLCPVLSSFSSLQLFIKSSLLKNVPLCLKWNTGMNRLGLKLSETEQVIELLQRSGRRELEHVMSHFSSSSLDVYKSQQCQQQYQYFLEIKSQLKAAGLNFQHTSMANSGAIEQAFALEESMIRPGLMLYGPSAKLPTLREISRWDGRNISRLETQIISGELLQRGTPVGYGGTPLPQDGWLIHMALGYGDGFFSFLQGAKISQGGHVGVVVGRVNMDLTALLFPPEAASLLKVGDPFTVWDHEFNNLYGLCQQKKLIPYELFTGVSARIPRIFV